MLKSLLVTSGLALSLTLPTGRVVEGPQPGDMAPEIEVGTWFNNTGRVPTLSELRGKTVLLEFWATW